MKLLKSSFWLNAVFYTVLQRFSTFFFGAVSYMLIARAYGDEKANMAIWGMYLIILSLFEMVKQGMLRNPTIKFLGMAEYKEKRKEVQSSALAINVCFSAIIIILVVFLSGALSSLLKSPALTPLLWWSIAMVLLLIPFNHYEVLLQAHFQFQKIFVAYIVRQGIFFAGVTILYFFFREQFTLMNLVWLQIAALAIGTLILFISTASVRLKGYHHDLAIIRQMFHFGKYVFGTSLLSSIYKFADHFVTASAIGNPVAGKIFVSYYSVVARITGLVDFPFMAVADVLFPKNAQAMSTEGPAKVKYYFERMVGILTALIVPVSLFLFFVPELILKVITGPQYPQYTEAVPILQITMFFAFLRPFFSNFGFTMDSIGKPQMNFYFNVFIVLLSLASTYFSIQIFGGKMGAVYASTFILIVSSTIIYFILRRNLNIQLSNIFRYMLATYLDLFTLIRKFPSRLKVV